jgi:DNA-binding transcriptional MocR family regulator
MQADVALQKTQPVTNSGVRLQPAFSPYLRARLETHMNSETLNPAAEAIAPRALYIEVADRLRRLIQSHAMAPGEWIDEQALATQYGISRTPLREALKVLATEGMVVLKPRRGCYVAQISGGDLEEIYPIMAPPAARPTPTWPSWPRCTRRSKTARRRATSTAFSTPTSASTCSSTTSPATAAWRR